jgi:hypothetical protein
MQLFKTLSTSEKLQESKYSNVGSPTIFAPPVNLNNEIRVLYIYYMIFTFYIRNENKRFWAILSI